MAQYKNRHSQRFQPGYFLISGHRTIGIHEYQLYTALLKISKREQSIHSFLSVNPP
jgi:hypothetical protein